MTATKPRTEWWDADNKLITFPCEGVTAVFIDGPCAGWHYVDCKALNHPPVEVDFPPTRERPTVVYQRDDTSPKLTYRVVTDAVMAVDA